MVSSETRKQLKNFVNPDWLTGANSAFEHFMSMQFAKLREEYTKNVCFPPSHLIFRVFNETPFEEVKVVILGQDPYHDGSATGLAFDNARGRSVSPSLRNILKEIEDDIGVTASKDNPTSYLEHLPSQGVLLLNTALSVPKGTPEGHLEYWQEFTSEIIKSLQKIPNVIWILWGKKAQAFESRITNTSHKVIKGAHPSPFSARAGFLGGKFFSKCNSLLKREIKW
jgi:uracil-DNA glycosylase